MGTDHVQGLELRVGKSLSVPAPVKETYHKREPRDRNRGVGTDASSPRTSGLFTKARAKREFLTIAPAFAQP